jgi:hypothetical protein
MQKADLVILFQGLNVSPVPAMHRTPFFLQVPRFRKWIISRHWGPFCLVRYVSLLFCVPGLFEWAAPFFLPGAAGPEPVAVSSDRSSSPLFEGLREGCLILFVGHYKRYAGSRKCRIPPAGEGGYL